MRVVVTGGELVTEQGPIAADLLLSGGRVEAWLDRGATVAADERVDAAGLLVFPGFIDPHVHSRDPGHTHKETFHHATLGALCGGTTTVLEMPNAVPAVTDVATFEQRRAAHAERAWTDFGLWGMALGPANLDDVPLLHRAGAVAVKFFWGYALDKETKGLVYNFAAAPPESLLLPPENGEVLELFRTVAGYGGLLAAHCEDRHVLARSAELLGHPITTYDDLLAARPAVAEAASIAVGAQFSLATGCRFHVVHMASAAGATVVREARAAGAAVTAETCPQYLTLTDADADRLGPAIKVYPPVRSQADQDALWAGIADGTIGSVGSDHAPHLLEEKLRGFEDAPAGGLGVETLAPLMVDAMARGRITPSRLAEVLSAGTARLYGLWPRKGSLRPGADADLTLVDPRGSARIANERMHALNPVTTWDGWELHGRVVASLLGGVPAMRDGEPVGERRGRFVAARHSGVFA
ncbi:dihydroorotase [Jiangella alba]|uniref:Dihydroorotase n=1 Tax=Jiangella alba TaxID=561176 RepID=A0A1H5KUM9_9ACTN|nr:dihydroorotase family protein [Jiangella alba]SEE68410.1 dihydroorotase [Jiangella alba]